MVCHPVLIQRPVVTADDGTILLGRDAESLARVLPNRDRSPLPGQAPD